MRILKRGLIKLKRKMKKKYNYANEYYNKYMNLKKKLNISTI